MKGEMRNESSEPKMEKRLVFKWSNFSLKTSFIKIKLEHTQPSFGINRQQNAEVDPR